MIKFSNFTKSITKQFFKLNSIKTENKLKNSSLFSSIRNFPRFPQSRFGNSVSQRQNFAKEETNELIMSSSKQQRTKPNYDGIQLPNISKSDIQNGKRNSWLIYFVSFGLHLGIVGGIGYGLSRVHWSLASVFCSYWVLSDFLMFFPNLVHKKANVPKRKS